MVAPKQGTGQAAVTPKEREKLKKQREKEEKRLRKEQREPRKKGSGDRDDDGASPVADLTRSTARLLCLRVRSPRRRREPMIGRSRMGVQPRADRHRRFFPWWGTVGKRLVLE